MSYTTFMFVLLRCGLCQNDYRVELRLDETSIPHCPKCQNSTLQMLRGPEVKPARR